MSLRSPQQAGITGTALTMTAVTASDTVAPDDRSVWLVNNGSGSPVTVTVVVPGTVYGQARPDVAVSVAAGALAPIGPLVADLADPATGLITITHSAQTSITAAVVRV